MLCYKTYLRKEQKFGLKVKTCYYYGQTIYNIPDISKNSC